MASTGKGDRLIGWHVLIAAKKGRHVFFDSCPEGVPELWCAQRGEVRSYDRQSADLVLEWLANEGGSIQLRCNKIAQPLYRDYGLLPANDPRLVLPLQNSRQLQRGLVMHSPGRRTAKVVVVVARKLAWLGITAPLRRRVLQIDCTLAPEPEFDPASVLYLGTADGCRKTTILPPRDGIIQKFGRGLEAKCAVEAETAALAYLANTKMSDRIPQIISIAETQDGLLLQQEFRARARQRAMRKEREIIRFLADLSELDYEVRDGIPGHRCHGDFAPWNCQWTNSGLFVFDWEKSKAWAPALTDAFYYVVAPFAHIDGSLSAEEVISKASVFASKVAAACGLNTNLVPMLWTAWLDSLPFEQEHEELTTILRRPRA